MAKTFKKIQLYEKVKGKKSRQGCGTGSKGMKKYKGQGGPRKRVKKNKK